MKRKLGPRGQVVIPKEIREKLALREGVSLTFEIAADAIVVRRELTPDEFLARFISIEGRKGRRRGDWKALYDEQYHVPGRR